MFLKSLKIKHSQDHRKERFSRGKFLNSVKRKHPQSRSSRGKILKRKDSQELQEETSSRSSRLSRGKFLKSLERKHPQDTQDHQEESFSKGEFLKSLANIKIQKLEQATCQVPWVWVWAQVGPILVGLTVNDLGGFENCRSDFDFIQELTTLCSSKLGKGAVYSIV